MELAVLIGLTLLAVPFILPIVSWLSARRTRDRLDQLSNLVQEQQSDIRRLTNRLALLEQGARPLDSADLARGKPVEIEPERKPAARAPSPARPSPGLPAPTRVTPPVVPPAPPPPQSTEPPLRQPGEPPQAPERPAPPPAPHIPPPVSAPPVSAPPISAKPIDVPPPPPPPIVEDVEPAWQMPALDWERFVGVRLFSAIAGIALVLAGVFFLRYSIEHGWLQPPVRVAIGVLTGIGLLVACELKAARKYPITANALDAAAVAILFSTFFSAYALWKLIPASVAFGLLALVTATAVLLSIRRESLFIAVLGLLGGFATPALLSTGENRPIGLFSYLMLLNVGLAWVAHYKRWPILTALTLVFTTVYQWGWVVRFLDASQLPLAAGIFVAFAVVSFAALVLASAREAENEQSPWFEKTALIAAGMPLIFGMYFASVPEYRDHFWLLFGFLFLVDAGLFAISVARREPLMHAAAAGTTVLVFAVWLTQSYTNAAWPWVPAIVAVFVLLYLVAPSLAALLDRPMEGPADHAVYAAPILLFVFPALVGLEPATADPAWLFSWLFALLLIIAWRAAAIDHSPAYYVAAFVALVAEAFWSSRYLQLERLREAIALYAIFAVTYLGVPVAARHFGRPLGPAQASGVVLLASLALLFFLAAGSLAPVALWGFALLLAILNAALFVEAAAVGLPALSFAGSLMSWVLLANWWFRAASAVGVLSSLLVVVGLTLLMAGGYAWTRQRTGTPRGEADVQLRAGFYLALIGHLFLIAASTDPRLSIPPWPLFGALAVMTLALMATAFGQREGALHAATMVASATVVLAFAVAARAMPWPSVALGAFGAVAATALLAIPLSTRFGFRSVAAQAAAATLFIAEFGAMAADSQPGAPPVWLLLLWHLAALSVLLFLTARYGWRHVALGAAAVAGLAVTAWRARHPEAASWRDLLTLSAGMFAVFVAYPLVLGRRGRNDRDPYLAAILASAWMFFAARHAFVLGGLQWMMGIVPVSLAAVMALLLYQLLQIERGASRDLGRLALVAATALGFVTVAIPLQLEEQWITLGWALEGAALAWLFWRLPHRGLLYGAAALLAVVFVRLTLNPEIFRYGAGGDEIRRGLPILNWYLYTYLVSAAAMFASALWFAKTNDRVLDGVPRLSHLASAAGVILLFALLNIEIADFYSTGTEIVFRFGESIAQDLTYTIGWLVFGLGLLAAGIALGNKPARVTAVALIALTTFKCFLYDLGSLAGLYRVAAFVGLAISLILVSLALQKYVLADPRKTA